MPYTQLISNPAASLDSNPERAPIEERTARVRDLMSRARNEKFAIGAFNVDNFETLLGIARAASAMASPAFVEASASEVAVLGLSNLRDLVDNLVAELGVELYLNLDHAPTVELALAAIDAGFELIHLDVFQLHHDAPVDLVVSTTREVVEYARRTGALVESELGYLSGSSTVHQTTPDSTAVRASLSSPELVREFVHTTGIDTFAVAIGNAHGVYPVTPQLDLELLDRLRASVDVNLSLHGGSGTPPEVYREVARRGISKINVNTDIRYAYRTALERQLRAQPAEYATVKLIGPVVDAVQAVVEEKMTAFASVGRQQRGSHRA